MQFLKAHYEKLILSVVLLGLAAAAALMLMKVAQERQKEEDRKGTIRNPKITALQPVDISTNTMVLARLEQGQKVNFDGEHVLFNPVRWMRRPDGSIMKMSQAGLNSLKVTEISPLHLVVSFDGPNGSPENLQYQLTVIREMGRTTNRTPRIAALKAKNNMFTILEVIGDPQDPKEVKVLLEGEKEPITISRDKPYSRITGYAADFRYDPENRTWKGLKVKDEISLSGETYNIVAITENEVVLSAKSNKKQTTLEYKPPQQ